MFQPNMPVDGMESYDQPFPHACWWVNGGFVAIYGPQADSAALVAAPAINQDPGRMMLSHDSLDVSIANGESASITYYVAFGPGGSSEAHALAEHVQEEPAAISPSGILIATWGSIKKK